MKTWPALCAALAFIACSKGDDQAQQGRVERGMKLWIAGELSAFHAAAADLQRAAPTPSGRGWSSVEDAAAIERMKQAWSRARKAYELVEGAVAPLFPDSDTATDARYDDFMVALGPAGDAEPFDDRGVVGVHAIERVLWADAVPKETAAFESRLPGYRAAAFPSTEAEARSFKDQLARKLVADIEQLEQQLQPVDLDIAFAFRGLIDLTNEQIEKVDRAATGREESRYAQATLRDLRANREGCLAAYRIFQPWLLARGRSDLDAQVMAGKDGSSRCDDSYFAQIFAGFSTLTIPMIYTPGDNEWTDCHRANNGAYNPLERLDAVRKLFFPVPGLALGGGFKQVLTQAEDVGFEKYVENQLWFDAGVAFGAVHIVGSNDSKIKWYTDDTTGTKVDDAAARDAERTAREAAGVAWIDRLFNVAAEQKAAGVVIAMQADTFIGGAGDDSFNTLLQRIATRAKAFGKPVLMLQGDSHVYVNDKPLENGSVAHGVTITVPNLTRIVVQGSTTKPLTEWLRLHVDPSTPAVFTWERNAR